MTPEEKFKEADLKYLRIEELTTVEDCAYIMTALSSIIAQIDGQLGKARARYYAEGEYSDPKWYTATCSALKHMRRKRQMTQDRRGELSKLLKEERRGIEQQRRERSERRFIEMAKIVLDNETYLRIWGMVNDEIQ